MDELPCKAVKKKMIDSLQASKGGLFYRLNIKYLRQRNPKGRYQEYEHSLGFAARDAITTYYLVKPDIRQ